MSAKFCANCGSPVDAAATFCGRCGARITQGVAPPPAAAPQPQAPPPPYVPPPAAPAPPYPYAMPPSAAAPYPAYDYAGAERKKRIDRTRTGVLLITIGLLLSWVPFIGLLGAVLILIGAILVILGRKAFGDRHSTFVLIAIIVFFVGAIAGGAVALIFGLQAAAAVIAQDLAAAAAAVQAGAIAAIAGAAVSGIATVLFVHELENKTGKYLLYGGYAAGIAVNGIIAGLTISEVAAAVARGDLSGITTVVNQLTTLNLLTGVSSVLYAGAYYIAYSRIQRREIPPPVAPPAPAPTWPAAGTTMYAPPAPPPSASPAAPAAPAAPPPSSPPGNPPGPDEL